MKSLTLFVSLSLSATTFAAPQPSPLFSAGCVVAREKPLVIFGDKAAPGEIVSVMLAGQNANAAADENGRWQVKLPAFKAGGPYELKISAPSGETVVPDVLVGDLWLCAGQSNMGMAVKDSDVADIAVAASADSQLRIFGLRLIARPYPRRDLYEVEKLKWRASSPETARGTSAVAWSFAHHLRKSGVPVGIVVGAWGGTRAMAWTPRETLAKDFAAELARYDEKIKDVPLDFNAWFEPPLGHAGTPTYIYNALIHPLTPAVFTGVLWYQGEQDSGMGLKYKDALAALVSGWRDKFQDPQLPFVLVQLPGFGGDYSTGFPGTRLGQAAATREIANTALVVTVDTGDPKDIHPKQKLEIGRRAALAAQGFVHGAKVLWQAPVAEAATLKKDGAVRVRFAVAPSKLASLDNAALRAFEVTGDDGKWTPAQATIDGDCVIVKAEGIAQPKRVRYAMSPWPGANLGSAEGLAAAPFVLPIAAQ